MRLVGIKQKKGTPKPLKPEVFIKKGTLRKGFTQLVLLASLIVPASCRDVVDFGTLYFTDAKPETTGKVVDCAGSDVKETREPTKKDQTPETTGGKDTHEEDAGNETSN